MKPGALELATAIITLRSTAIRRTTSQSDSRLSQFAGHGASGGTRYLSGRAPPSPLVPRWGTHVGAGSANGSGYVRTRGETLRNTPPPTGGTRCATPSPPSRRTRRTPCFEGRGCSPAAGKGAPGFGMFRALGADKAEDTESESERLERRSVGVVEQRLSWGTWTHT
eukprot:1190891-Prorocentrum_minimum.AAC.1